MLDEAAPARLVMMHRDLHEKQLLIVRGQPIALLDLDELGPGDPAIDVGNLLAHFELRAIQNPARRARTRLVAEAFLDGYSAEPELLTRVPAYLLSARLRLAAVYAFRAAPEDLVEALLHPAPDLETLL
jgi:aminoglycoside phosphotransferase (APT) family kinase protein